MHLFDHTTPSWRQYPHLVTGAITYSEDIIKFQLPYWQKLLGKHDVLSTAPPLDTIQLPRRVDNIILYLHTWPYSEETHRIEQYTKDIKANIIFITAYLPFCELLRKKGYKAVYIPMSIDTEKIQQYQLKKANHNRVVYYGNVSNFKRQLFREIKNTCKELNIELDVVSWNIFMGQKMTQEDALRFVSTYNYGIGVGRCALELMALNVKQVIAGRKLGGLITNDDEYELQRQVNMNGRLCTYSDSLKECFLNINRAIIKTAPIQNHVREILKQYPNF